MHNAYFAGFFDADGSVMILHPPGRSHWLQVAVWQNTKDVLLAFQAHFGGTVQTQHRPRGNKRAVYVWKVNHGKAERFLGSVLPWLVVKRERAELALAFRDTFRAELAMLPGRSTARSRAHNKFVQERREQYRQQLMALNRRGIEETTA